MWTEGELVIFIKPIREFLFQIVELYNYNLLQLSSMAGSDSSTTNYPGKIPPGLDLPSDIADGKLENEARNSGLT